MKNKFSRRSFLRKVSQGVAGATAFSVLSNNFTLIPGVFGSTPEKTMNCEFGVEGSVPHEARALDEFLKATRALGADFIVGQFSPKNYNPAIKKNNSAWLWEGTRENFKDLSLACRKYNMSFFVNQEVTNYTKEGDILDEKGNDILAHHGNTHRWDITGELLKDAAANKEFRGVLYDEAEHGQMRREANTNGGDDSHASKGIHPYFAATDGMSLEEAHQAVYRSAKAVAENYRKMGVVPMTEAVFTAMQLIFARAGFDIGIKLMKESLDPIYGAIGIGAAKQYGREFCAAPDLWGFTWGKPDTFPGHPPEELKASLLYAYWIGSTRIFVENIRGLTEKKTVNGISRYEPTEYGKVYQWFVKEYVPSHPRSYTFRDIKPDIAILRFDDSDWGQKNSRFSDNLFGAANLHTSPETSAWFKIWNLLTHGQSSEETISYNSKGYQGIPHDFFYPLNGVVVYDHLAGEKELEGLELVFLTGVKISPRSLKAVQNFVQKGGFCISLNSLAPAEYLNGSGVVKEGTGRWLFVKDFNSGEVRKEIAPYIGKPDEISYRIGSQRLIIKKGKDRNDINIYLQNDKELKESARVY